MYYKTYYKLSNKNFYSKIVDLPLCPYTKRKSTSVQWAIDSKFVLFKS